MKIATNILRSLRSPSSTEVIRVLEEKRKKKENLSLDGLLIYLTIRD